MGGGGRGAHSTGKGYAGFSSMSVSRAFCYICAAKSFKGAQGGAGAKGGGGFVPVSSGHHTEKQPLRALTGENWYTQCKITTLSRKILRSPKPVVKTKWGEKAQRRPQRYLWREQAPLLPEIMSGKAR